MSEISYPVVGDAPPCRTSVWSSDGAEVCNCRTEGTAVDGEARARRIAAALNATRNLTVEQLETGDVQFSGSRLAECGEVTIGCISRDARELLDDIMDAYKAHYPRLCETCPKDSDVFGAPVSPDDAYGFAYWLVRWSGLVRPANSGSAAKGE